jgi:HD-GYP domain-containing protein (c-di-GMP phosphodiesterase class II)
MLYGNLRIPASKLSKLADIMLDRVSIEHKALIENDLSDSDLHWARPHISQVLAVPMRREDRFFGAMFAFNKSDGPFATSDIKLISAIANQAAVFLENSLLFADMKSLVLGLMRSLTSAVDAKDPYTAGHSERVAELAQLLARACGMDEETTQRIYLAGLLHDVGKIGVPEAVLKKPGRLSEEEFEQMKAHPRIGEKIIADIPQLADVLPGVLHHHERFDGKGYPANLQGEEIPLMARILCLADALDAMTSDRTYRPRMAMNMPSTKSPNAPAVSSIHTLLTN